DRLPFTDGVRFAGKDQEGSLEGVLGVFLAAEHAAAQPQDHAAVAPDERFKRRLVAGHDEPLEQVGVGQAAALAPAGNVAEQLNERAQSCLAHGVRHSEIRHACIERRSARALSVKTRIFSREWIAISPLPQGKRGACQFRRSARPGRSPVCFPSSSTTLPLTRTYTMPSLYWNGLEKVARSMIRSGSKTTTSAKWPG